MIVNTGIINTGKINAGVLLLLLPTAFSYAADELSCTIDVLQDIGWKTMENSTDIGFENTAICDTNFTPVFKYNTGTEDKKKLLNRSKLTLNSVTSKCLFYRDYQSAVVTAVKNLTDNKEFKFLPVADDPRDPFLPPDGTWDSETAKGYDIPKNSIQGSIQSLYKKPFVAECSTATQIVQLAALTEHYGKTTDEMLELTDVGIGTWKQYTKVPSIAAKQSLFIDRKIRKADGLKELATLGRAAFYGQIGYIRPHKGKNYIDSIDNLGQNYMIVEISDKAVASIQARKNPLKELSKVSRKIWKKYRIRQSEGTDIETLMAEMQAELESSDPFFSEVAIYVHPLRVKNFAQHIARQFKFNPRTPYVFEVYEDYQPGFFYTRYIEHQLKQCMQ